jgi:hypothetical protein
MTRSGWLPSFTDERGRLLPLEFGALPFVPVRLFVVTGPEGGARRGGHLVPCRELLVLLTGAVTVEYAGETTRLAEAGRWLLLEPGERVDYDLAPGGSTIAVLADAPYAGTHAPGDT